MIEHFRPHSDLARIRDSLQHLAKSIFTRASFHPILFAALPILRCFADNTDCVMYQEIWAPVALATLSATIIYFLINLILKDWPRSGLITTTLCLYFFAFRQATTCVNNTLQTLHLVSIRPATFVLPYLFLLALTIYACLKGVNQIGKVTVALNSISLVLTTIAINQIFLHEIYIDPICQELINENYQDGQEIKLKAAQKKHDIYYIVIDACGSPSTLAHFYHYDNSDFIHYLKQKGFYVAENTRSNYGRTKHCLSSTLNMRYLDFLAEKLDADFYDDRIPYSLIQQNTVIHSLKQLGYKFVNISSGFAPTDYNDYADVNISGGWGNQNYLALANMTILSGLEDLFCIIRNQARIKRLCAVRALDTINTIPGPKFVFIHILMPHPPYFFGANGEMLPFSDNVIEGAYDPLKYVALLQFAQKQVSLIIDSITSKDNQIQPIIILQGDHGPAFNYLDEAHPSSDYLLERFHPLNAYYFPDVENKGLYQSISPVNSFRVLFNDYFQANLKLLPDKTFFSPLFRPYDWREITLDNKAIPYKISAQIPSTKHLNNKASSNKKHGNAGSID